MRTWIAECYLPGLDRASTAQAEASIRDALGGAADGSAVRYRGALLVAADEVVFHVFEAADAEAVRDVVARSGIAAARVVEAEAVPHAGPDDLLSVLIDRVPPPPAQS